VAKADYLIDLHSNVQPSIPFSIVRRTPDEALNATSQKMADAFGLTTVRMVLKFEQHRTGTMSDWALAHGIPAVVIELVDSRRIHEPSARMGVRGVLNAMKALNMLDGQVEAQTDMVVHKGNFTRMELTADKGGLVHRGKEAGEAVRKGDLLATFYDPYGNVVDELRSPVDGYVLAYPMRESQALATGNMVIFLAFEPSE
jgi:predicted deacylase